MDNADPWRSRPPGELRLLLGRRYHQSDNMISVQPGIDPWVNSEEHRDYVDLHAGLDFWTPMGSGAVNAILEHLALKPGDRLLDVGCGHGSFLLHASRRHRLNATGIDLNPFAIQLAASRARADETITGLDWIIGDARNLLPGEQWDAVTCFGTGWVWGGYEPALAALTGLVPAGGRIAISDHRLDLMPELGLHQAYGPVATRREQMDAHRKHRTKVVAEVLTPMTEWRAQQHAWLRCMREYALDHPGPETARRAQEAQDWLNEHGDDWRYLTWVTVIAEVCA